MEPALWVAKTGLDAQNTRMQVIAHNLANVNTTGFKRDRASFEDLLYQTVRQPGAASSQNSELPSGLMLGGQYTWVDYFLWNEIPTVVGNLVGGITFVGAMIYSTHYKTSPKRNRVAARPADSALASAESR